MDEPAAALEFFERCIWKKLFKLKTEIGWVES
jgi:hypothetical protein